MLLHTHAFSSCSEQELLSRPMGFSLQQFLLLQRMGSRVLGLQELWLTGSRALTQYFWHTKKAVPQHTGSSWTRDQICVPCTSRQILNPWTTRKAPAISFQYPNAPGRHLGEVFKCGDSLDSDHPSINHCYVNYWPCKHSKPHLSPCL